MIEDRSRKRLERLGSMYLDMSSWIRGPLFKGFSSEHSI
jgi:hypothetical protein